MIRIIKAEFYRIKHTWLPYLHGLLPILYAGMFYLAATTTSLKNYDVLAISEIYLVLLGAALPIVFGAITAKVADMEANAGGFQVLLGTPLSRIKVYSGKLLVLFLGAFFSISLAVLCFGLLFGQQSLYAWWLEGFLLWLGSLLTYMLHLWLALSFGAGATLGLGFAESLLALLAMTNLGDGIWQFLPATWPARLPATDLLVGHMADPSHHLHLSQDFERWFYIALPLTVVIFIASLLWFKCWEGQSRTE